jgi:hypothetical protein
MFFIVLFNFCSVLYMILHHVVSSALSVFKQLCDCVLVFLCNFNSFPTDDAQTVKVNHDTQTRKHNAPILLYVGHKKLYHISLHLYLMLKENSPKMFYYKVLKILLGAFILKVHVHFCQFWCQLYIKKNRLNTLVNGV